MWNQVSEHIRRIARRECERVLRLSLQPRYGNIVEWDPKTHRAKVEVQPEGVVSNWIPTMSPWVGNGWGMIQSHSVGDQVMMVFPEYGSNEGAIIGRVFDERNPPPQVIKDSEFMMVHKSGAMIKFAQDGTVIIGSQGDINFVAKGKIKLKGSEVDIVGCDLKADQEIVWNNKSSATHASTHTHGGVSTGSASTQKPDAGS
jgi:phage baseplate assembly protein gpV